MILPTHATLCACAASALLAAALASGGTYKVMDWREQAHNTKRLKAEQAAEAIAQTDAKQQRKFNDKAAGDHAAQLATLKTQLGDARAHIATLSNRRCLSARTVGLLNNIAPSPPELGVRAPAGQPAGAPQAPAADPADDAGAGYASERDTAGAIAQCRAGYAELAGQLDAILDIEDARGK